jgi:hypothetical protein
MHERTETSMENPPFTDGAGMAALATHAALPLSPERAAAAAAILAAWLPAAHELSRKMSAPEHRALMPATVFAHAPERADARDPQGAADLPGMAAAAGGRP